MNIDNSDDDRFFFDLLKQTKNKFKETPIYAKQMNEKNQILWHYSVCGTPIQSGKGVIMGINWGVGKDSHRPQEGIPPGDDIIEYSFMKRSNSLFKDYLKLDIDKKNFNYTNLCFFRSPKAADLAPKDFELSLPLFKQYICHINPPWIFSLGNAVIHPLKELGELEDIKSYPGSSNGKTFKGFSGQLWDWKFYNVPHPNAHMTSSVRKTIWEKVLDGISLGMNK